MRIQVKLHAQLRKFAPKKTQNPMTIEIADGAAVSDLLARIGVPVEKAKLIIVNGMRGAPSDTLTDGAVVDFFPPIAGG